MQNDLDPVDLAQKFLEVDNEFHRTLFEAAGRESVWEYIESLQYHYNRLRMFVNRADKDKLRKVYEQHCQIVKRQRLRSYNLPGTYFGRRNSINES